MNYRNLTPEELQNWQRQLFLFLCRFDSFCRKHHITYSLTGGLVLGSIRNQNFIPWDDDVDIMLSTENFQRLIQLKSLMPSHWSFNPNAEVPHIKNLNYHMTVFSPTKQEEYEHYIWIDIFELVTTHPLIQIIFKFRNLLQNKSKYPIFHWRNFLPRFLRIILSSKFRKFLKKWACTYKKSNYLTYACPFFQRILFQKSDIFPVSKNLKIKNYLFPGPKNIHKYLTTEYGENYITPPVTTERHTHLKKKL